MKRFNLVYIHAPFPDCLTINGKVFLNLTDAEKLNYGNVNPVIDEIKTLLDAFPHQQVSALTVAKCINCINADITTISKVAVLFGYLFIESEPKMRQEFLSQVLSASKKSCCFSTMCQEMKKANEENIGNEIEAENVSDIITLMMHGSLWYLINEFDSVKELLLKKEHHKINV